MTESIVRIKIVFIFEQLQYKKQQQNREKTTSF
jgi:hypothetical protein